MPFNKLFGLVVIIFTFPRLLVFVVGGRGGGRGNKSTIFSDICGVMDVPRQDWSSRNGDYNRFSDCRNDNLWGKA
jgi:hypothetical protein